MLQNQKLVFIILCAIMVLVNGFLYSEKGAVSVASLIGGGIGGSVLSIPLWACIGVVLSNIFLFFYKIVRPEGKEPLSMLQKAGIGIIAGILFKLLLIIRDNGLISHLGLL